MSLARLTALADAAAAARDAELARLSALSRQIEDKMAKMAALRSGSVAVSGIAPAAESLWARGRTARLRSMAAELATLLARRDSQIARSRRAFGRARVAAELLARAKAKQARQRRIKLDA